MPRKKRLLNMTSGAQSTLYILIGTMVFALVILLIWGCGR